MEYECGARKRPFAEKRTRQVTELVVLNFKAAISRPLITVP